MQMVWLESPTNPLLKVIDIEAIARIAHQHNDVSVMNKRMLFARDLATKNNRRS